MKPIALYARVSTDDQHPEAQLAELRAYAKRRTGEGLSKMEIIRCLRHFLTRDFLTRGVYRALRADLHERPGLVSLESITGHAALGSPCSRLFPCVSRRH